MQLVDVSGMAYEPRHDHGRLPARGAVRSGWHPAGQCAGLRRHLRCDAGRAWPCADRSGDVAPGGVEGLAGDGVGGLPGTGCRRAR
ncbi:hypothetical protein G6F35_018733 [Rhizopus arrhizus]|nr:hypothetical protein G6F35_018733 [Rhizopus arrhizus]